MPLVIGLPVLLILGAVAYAVSLPGRYSRCKTRMRRLGEAEDDATPRLHRPDDDDRRGSASTASSWGASSNASSHSSSTSSSDSSGSGFSGGSSGGSGGGGKW